MPTRNRSKAGTLVLEQLNIPGKTGPVPGLPKVWGINIAAALDNFPRQGLLCHAGPWAPMNVGDFVTINWGSSGEVLQKTIGPADLGQPKTLFVESRHIQEGQADVFYSVKRVGQAWEDSETIQLLIKLTRPGGHDDNAEPGHSKLIFRIPQEILNGGIDKDNVGAGVPITIERYPNIALGDVIQVTWGGVFVLSDPLTQDQVDGKVPIVVHISEAVIRDAGDSDGVGLDVAIEVYDIVDNRSEDWSAPQRVVVAVDKTRILAPMLRQAVNNTLDLDTLGDQKGSAQIWAIAPEFQVGDTIVLSVKGTPLEGAPINIEISSKPLENVPSTSEIEIPNALLRQLAKTQLVMFYRLKKANGSPDLHSKSQFIRVVGEPQRLAPPVALDAVQGALDPELTTVRIEIPWDDSFAAGQAIKLIWLGTTPGMTPYLPELTPRPITNGDFVAKEPLKISVDGKHLLSIIGGTLEIYYQQLIDDGVLRTMNQINATHAVRESIHADILQVGEPRKELPAPDVAGVIEGALPVHPDGTTLTVNYLNTVKGDEVIYEWDGSKVKESDSVTLSSFTAGKSVTFDIEAQYIKGNEGGTVSARYSIKRAAGGTSYSDTLEFSIGDALENPLPVAQLPQASGVGASVTLAPLDAQTGAKVIVAYTGMNTAQNIELIMAGKTGAGSPQIPSKPGSTSGSVEFLIEPEAIAANIGNGSTTFQLTYEVTQGNNKIPSLPLKVTVTQLPASELDKVSILQASGDELDTSNITADATVRVGVWRFMKVGQPVWLVAKGKDAQGVAQSLVLWEAPGASVNQQWIESGQILQGLLYSYLKKLGHGTDLELHLKAALTSSPVEAEAIVASVKRYTIKAVEDVKPTISSVHDSKGVPIPQNGFTVDPDVMLEGTAAPNQRILIHNNGESTGGEATADAQGKWSRQLRGLAVGDCKLTAVAQYGTQPESAEWKIIVTPVVTPTITSVVDSKGVEIPHGGTTVDTSVTLTGRASKGQMVDVKDGSASKGKAPVDPTTGVWTLVVPGLSVAEHSFTAKAEYGAGPVSAARTLTVAALAPPTISSVKDPYGKEVPNGSTITDDSVTLTGTATAGLEVEIFDGTTSKGKAQVNASGVWTKGIVGLAIGLRSLTAKGIYGGNPVSVARTFVVTNALIPAITSVKDPKGVEIPHNGTTSDTSVTLTGTATANREVEIFDGTTSKGQRSVNSEGVWTYVATALAPRPYTFKAKAMYGSETESPVRTFTVTVKKNITEDWELVPLGIFPFNHGFSTPTGLAIFVTPFTATPRASGIFLSDADVGRILVVGHGSFGIFQFPRLAATFEIEYYIGQGSTITINVYDEKPTLVLRETLVPNNGSYKIKKIDIGKNRSHFDLKVDGTSAVTITRVTWLQP